MSNLYKYNKNEKATVCANKTCVTVYGDTARVINNIVVFTVLVAALLYLAKAIR